jgi:hypothetical protein
MLFILYGLYYFRMSQFKEKRVASNCRQNSGHEGSLVQTRSKGAAGT